mmetsp:Transcript_72023/g.154165  ORF Transcript_72023/g.154165 Transcript_72023/m.154165 type:complete len:798 (-) Transcript_72023:186-2579(-)
MTLHILSSFVLVCVAHAHMLGGYLGKDNEEYSFMQVAKTVERQPLPPSAIVDSIPRTQNEGLTVSSILARADAAKHIPKRLPRFEYELEVIPSQPLSKQADTEPNTTNFQDSPQNATMLIGHGPFNHSYKLSAVVRTDPWIIRAGIHEGDVDELADAKNRFSIVCVMAVFPQKCVISATHLNKLLIWDGNGTIHLSPHNGEIVPEAIFNKVPRLFGAFTLYTLTGVGITTFENGTLSAPNESSIAATFLMLDPGEPRDTRVPAASTRPGDEEIVPDDLTELVPKQSVLPCWTFWKQMGVTKGRFGADMMCEEEHGLLITVGDYSDLDLVTPERLPGAMTAFERLWPYETEVISRQAFQTYWHPLVFLGVIAGLLLALVFYNIHVCMSSSQEERPSTRHMDFDIIKGVCQVLVVQTHVTLAWPGANMSEPLDASFFAPYKMPVYSLIAGIFGASLKYDSMAKMLCYTIGTSILIFLIYVMAVLVVSGSAGFAHMMVSNPMEELWFLGALLLWRTFLTPMFHLARSMSIPKLAMTAITIALSVVVMAFIPMQNMRNFAMYDVQHFFYYSSLFAVGLARTPEEWHAHLKSKWARAFGAAFFLWWHLMRLSPRFEVWNLGYGNLYNYYFGLFNFHYYPGAFEFPLSWSFWGYHVLLEVLNCCLAVSFMIVMSMVIDVIEMVAPRVNTYLASWGSRSMYSYVLHITLTHFLEIAFGHTNFEWGTPATTSCTWIFACMISWTFASKGTEKIFRPIVLPFWMKDAVERIIMLIWKKVSHGATNGLGNRGEGGEKGSVNIKIDED